MSENTIKLPILDLSVDRHAAFQVWIEKWNDYVLIEICVFRRSKKYL